MKQKNPLESFGDTLTQSERHQLVTYLIKKEKTADRMFVFVSTIVFTEMLRGCSSSCFMPH